MPLRTRAYDRVAWCYDALAAWWSRGAIERARRAHLDTLRPGMRVVYVGVGTGAEAVEAAALGARVTAIDPSPAMRARLGRRARAADVSLAVYPDDLFAHRPPRGFDVVVAPYVLDLFAERRARRAFAWLAGWLAPGGWLWISDFTPAARLATVASRWHHRLVAVPAALLGFAEWHWHAHDYVAWGEELGLELRERHGYRVRARGTVLHETLAWTRAAASAEQTETALAAQA